jgi:hypothetical protein
MDVLRARAVMDILLGTDSRPLGTRRDGADATGSGSREPWTSEQIQRIVTRPGHQPSRAGPRSQAGRRDEGGVGSDAPPFGEAASRGARGSAIAQIGSGAANQGPDTLCTLARAPGLATGRKLYLSRAEV